MREAKASHIFSTKILANLGYLRLKFNETLTNDIVSFEQPGPVLLNHSQLCPVNIVEIILDLCPVNLDYSH